MDEAHIIKRHGQTIIDRFNRLYNAGYRVAPQWMMDIQFALVHPNKKAPKLALWHDGRVSYLFPQSDTPVWAVEGIAPDDAGGFDILVARTPKPTWLQKMTDTTIGEGVEALIGLAILGVIWLIAYRVIDWLFPGLKNLW
ncbi:hypothetical protein [Brevundimonas sp.]